VSAATVVVDGLRPTAVGAARQHDEAFALRRAVEGLEPHVVALERDDAAGMTLDVPQDDAVGPEHDAVPIDPSHSHGTRPRNRGTLKPDR